MNVAPRGGNWGERVRLSKAQKHLFDIAGLLETYYRLPEKSRNYWRYEQALESVKSTRAENL